MNNQSNTTSISELPINGQQPQQATPTLSTNSNHLTTNMPLQPSQNTNENIKMNFSEPVNVSLDPNTINQIVNELQQATLTGATQLPSRDIPTDTVELTTDEQLQPDYIPTNRDDVNSNYIDSDENINQIINQYETNINNEKYSENMYSDFQIPLLIAVLYFLFQLPIVRRFLYNYIPFLFMKDGNMNLNGYLFCSVLFGFTYFLFMKSMQMFDV